MSISAVSLPCLEFSVSSACQSFGVRSQCSLYFYVFIYVYSFSLHLYMICVRNSVKWVQSINGVSDEISILYSRSVISLIEMELLEFGIMIGEL